MTDLCPPNKAREWIESDRIDPLPAWESEADRDFRIKMLAAGGMTAPLNWFRAQLRPECTPLQGAIPPESDKLTVPMMFVGGDKDYASRIEFLHQSAAMVKEQGWLDDVDVKVVEGASHWVMLNKRAEFLEILEEAARRVG